MSVATGSGPRREPGIAAVAEAAGVSYMTVSRVINGREGVGDATRERIRKIIDEIGYRPNVMARALRTGRTHTIGVVCFATSFHGPASLLFSVEQAARAEGFSVNVITLNVLDEESIQLAVDELRELAIEAIIVISPHRSTGKALRSMPTDVPVVAIWGPEDVGMTVMGMDHVDAAARATQHLLALGHPTVWHVSGPEGWTGSDLRATGWRKALTDAGREVPPVFQGDWLATSGYEAGQHILAQPGVSAVFLSNDQMALGFMAAAREHGRRIPDDLSVIGYDDEPGSEFFMPPLTTIHQDFAYIGRRAFEFTRRLIESGTQVPAQVTALPAELIVRSSTGPYNL